MTRLKTAPSKLSASIVAGILLGALASCSTTTSRDVAESAVETFHSQFNAGSYGAIELSAAPEFKTRAGGAKAYLQKVRDIMGTVISSHGGPGSVQSMADGVQVHLVYVTNFVNGQAPETFVFRVKDNRASLVFYEVGAKGLTEN